MQLADLVTATDAVAATSARKEKIALLANVLRGARPGDMEIALLGLGRLKAFVRGCNAACAVPRWNSCTLRVLLEPQ